ncbi:hypothetical protein FM076_09200 [Streptomyces albus subsp. chlorinus]|uniref:hypothetical protein n=1 Tax=Streptomyces albus TaxID=1888 RepID=UPI00156F2E93|nr:hypothetical protein [Streptomyces albus]NSC21373.1 hypothetical protein [Streptomyces albus subsp. chlorinus]
MNLPKQLRISSALWASPVALGLTLFYFYVTFTDDYPNSRGEIDYAPEVVSFALNPASALAYAAAAALAAWESGRLTAGGVWAAAPARSPYHVAAQALFPVLLLSWLMLLIPVVGGLISEGVSPTLACLPLLGMSMFVTIAHCVIGFALGRAVPRLIAAPALAMAVFYAVAASASSGETFWPRHVLGEYHGVLAFGTTLPLKALAPHMIFAGGIAAGAAVLLTRPRSYRTRLALPAVAAVMAVAGPTAAYAQVSSWGASTPVSVGHAQMTCQGDKPEVCVPAAGSADPGRARADVVAVVADLARAGAVVRMPTTVQDSIINGNQSRSSTTRTWLLPLTSSQRHGTTRYETLSQAVRYPCPEPKEEVASRSVKLWAAQIAGVSRHYMKQQRAEINQIANGDELLRVVQKRVERVRAMPAERQAAWYRHELKRACVAPPDTEGAS